MLSLQQSMLLSVGSSTRVTMTHKCSNANATQWWNAVGLVHNWLGIGEEFSARLVCYYINNHTCLSVCNVFSVKVIVTLMKLHGTQLNKHV